MCKDDIVSVRADFVHTGDTSGNDNHVGAGKGLLHAIICGQVSLDLLCDAQLCSYNISACDAHGNGGDVGEIGSDTWSVHNIVKGELIDERASLEEEGQRLSNATGGSCDDDLHVVLGVID